MGGEKAHDCAQAKGMLGPAMAACAFGLRQRLKVRRLPREPFIDGHFNDVLDVGASRKRGVSQACGSLAGHRERHIRGRAFQRALRLRQKKPHIPLSHKSSPLFACLANCGAAHALFNKMEMRSRSLNHLM
jgi:hypothetical protein